jgi:DNA processing protein
MDYLPWLKLKSVPGIGNILFKRLIDRFGSPDRVFESSLEELQHVSGLSMRVARIIHDHKVPVDLVRDLENALNNGCRMSVMTDEEYPGLLHQLPDPPPYLFVKGTIPDIPAIAVVGSRNASTYGLSNARLMSRELVRCGACVVSGLAIGIDTAAHEGALEGGGPTIAVLGSGHGNIYPLRNRALAESISKYGAVISEFPFFTAPDARNFPIRNRIISGMSLGTLVVEASLKSGSLITARLAAEQNRDVFTIPGSIQSPRSTGTHSLLRDGAKLVSTVQDIVEEIPALSGRYTQPAPDENGSINVLERLKNKFNLDFNELSVIKVLDSYPVHIDDILQKLTMDAGLLSGILLKLELSGIVIQSPGKLFSMNEVVL